MQTQDRFLNVQLDGHGPIYLQVLDEEARWGFYITDGDNAWDGGFGMKPHSMLRATRRRSPRLEWVKDAIESGIAEPCFEKYALLYSGFPLPVYLKIFQIKHPRFKT